MKFSYFFIERPIFAMVISIVIVIAGLLAYFSLPTAQYPEIAPPTVQVTASYPGADPKVVAETVATPIEEQVNGVENMLYMASQSTADGSMTLTVTFQARHRFGHCSGAGAKPSRDRRRRNCRKKSAI